MKKEEFMKRDIEGFLKAITLASLEYGLILQGVIWDDDDDYGFSWIEEMDVNGRVIDRYYELDRKDDE